MESNALGTSLCKGKLVWERYWNGFGPDSRFDVYSAGKAFTAAAIGLLVDDGKLEVDEPACNVLTEWAGDERREITIRHLLTMTSGLKLDYERFGKSPDPTRATLDWPLERPPGTAWCYEQATSHALLMHPGPVNEGIELSSEVAHGAQSVIEAQVSNGLAVRMALLYLLMGGGKD